VDKLKYMKTTIKKILELGLKEYTPNKAFTSCDRSWQKRITEDIFIDVHFYKLSERCENMKDSFDIEVYHDNDSQAEQILIYSFDDFDLAYKRALEYIKFLTK